MPARDVETEFFAKFPCGAGVVVFAGVEMAGGAGIVAAGKGVLGGSALLDEELAGVIEHEDVDGTVAESQSVDLPAGGAADDPVRGVHDVEDFVGVLHGEKKSPSGVRGAFRCGSNPG